MRMLVAGLAAAAAVVAPAASAKQVPLSWLETWHGAGGAKVMWFRVSTIAGARGVWGVRASFRNTSAAPIHVSDQFGLAAFPTRTSTDTHHARLLKAGGFRPAAPPRVLRPGQRWRGTFTGVGKIPRGSYVRVVFGAFTGATIPRHAGIWITDHVQRF